MVIIKDLKINEVAHTAKNVTWFFEIVLRVVFYNPFKPKTFVKPWFSIMNNSSCRGFHFCGLRVVWSQGEEITSKRIVR